MQLGIDIGGTSVKTALWTQGACVRLGESAPSTRSPSTGVERSSAGEARGVDTVVMDRM